MKLAVACDKCTCKMYRAVDSKQYGKWPPCKCNHPAESHNDGKTFNNVPER